MTDDGMRLILLCSFNASETVQRRVRNTAEVLDVPLMFVNGIDYLRGPVVQVRSASGNSLQDTLAVGKLRTTELASVVIAMRDQLAAALSNEEKIREQGKQAQTVLRRLRHLLGKLGTCFRQG